MIGAEAKGLLTKYTQVAKKIIYNPERMRSFMKMLDSKEGALQAVQTVVAAIDKLKPVPPQLMPLLGVNCYMLMVDVAQEVTGFDPDPAILQEVAGQILQAFGGQEDPEEPGDAPGEDNTAAHEGAESPAFEKTEGSEEDAGEGGMLAQMQRRGAVA